MNIFPEPLFTAVLTWELEKKKRKKVKKLLSSVKEKAIIKQNMYRNEDGKEYPFNEKTFLAIGHVRCKSIL